MGYSPRGHRESKTEQLSLSLYPRWPHFLLVRRPAERKSNANSGLSSGAKTSAAVTRMCSEPQERLRGSSVTVQVGTGPGGGCRFSRAKDKLLRNLNKDL